MRYKIISVVCIIFFIICMTACGNKVSDEKKYKAREMSSPTIVLSSYAYENEFIDDEIDKIIHDYNIEGLDNIGKLIYYPIVDDDSIQKNENIKYIIDSKSERDICKDVIYSSVFEAPGGEAVLDRELMTYNEFENKCDEKKLEVALENACELDFSKEYKVKWKYDVEVEEGKRKTVKAYEIVKEYGYVVKNKKNTIGEGMLRKPIGILIGICEEDI